MKNVIGTKNRVEVLSYDPASTVTLARNSAISEDNFVEGQIATIQMTAATIVASIGNNTTMVNSAGIYKVMGVVISADYGKVVIATKAVVVGVLSANVKAMQVLLPATADALLTTQLTFAPLAAAPVSNVAGFLALQTKSSGQECQIQVNTDVGHYGVTT